MKPVSLILWASLMAMPTLATAQQPTSQLQSSSDLVEEGRDSWIYRNPATDFTKYKAFIIEPTVVSTDKTSLWGGTTPAQRSKYAEMFTRDLSGEVGKYHTLVREPGPGVAIIRLTLLGVTSTRSGVALVSRVTPVGLAAHGVKSIAGKRGSFTGAAQVAFELTDSGSGELLAAVVRRRSPDALDIGATLSTDATVAAVSRDVAESIREALDKGTARAQ